MWNDGASYTNVGMVDASARSVRMADVIARTSTNGGQQQDHIEAPSGVWNPGNGEMNLYLYGVNSGFDWGDLTQPRAAFFWATRHGLRGLDLP
jgi:hypothetical protein